jgi:hypothetical protein
MRPLPLRLSLALAGLLCVVLIALLVAGRPQPGLRIVFPALEGDGALITTPDGHTLLIDGGADGAAVATWLGSTLPFGQRHIDAVIATRADAHTLPGQIAALRRYNVREALIAASDRRTSSVDAWWSLLEDQATTAQTANAGDRIEAGGCSAEVLNAHDGRLSLLLQCGSTIVYFLQALDDDGEAALEELTLPPATLIVYPWDRPTNTPLLHRLQPAAIVFSEGGDGDLQASWAERQVGSARLYHEALSGAVELRDDGQRVTITTERGSDHGN